MKRHEQMDTIDYVMHDHNKEDCVDCNRINTAPFLLNEITTADLITDKKKYLLPRPMKNKPNQKKTR